uniref:NADH dehydrogenase subunit 6 n=1 Tax=Echyridella menziesii TaxID=981778 RepID=A0A1X9JUU4_9BIVA|nr:NADH dehydrogenase subunit 6 [Echyridella menziesii]AQT38533.1 NADH dehydrogenase subunit 6 [Echyridella menziesii]
MITLTMLTFMWIYSMVNLTMPMHPLPMGLMILSLAFTTCLLLSSTSPWYAYMLFFIFIGGMLVMFTYIASLSPNITLLVNTQPTILLLTMIILIILTTKMQPQIMRTTTELKSETSSTTQFISLLYYDNTSMMLLLLAAILLIMMVLVVKLCSTMAGTLRPYHPNQQ